MESTTHKTLIASNHSLGDNGLAHQNSLGCTDVITICLSEGHQINGIVATYFESTNTYDVKNLYFFGNYCNKTQFIYPKIIGNHRARNIYLIPMPGAPFSCFSKYNGGANTEDIIEPTNSKESKVGFIYYGNRPIRDLIVTKLFDNKLTQNLIYHSSDKNGDNPQIKLTEYNKIFQHLLPITSDFEYNHGHGDFFPHTIETASISLFYIVSETNYDENENQEYNVMTEKTTVPFFSKSIPIIFSYNSIETLEYLKSIGFDCFTDIIPVETYNIINEEQRIQTIIDIVKKTPLSFYEDNKKRFETNYSLAIKYRNWALTKTLESINNLVKEKNLNVIQII